MLINNAVITGSFIVNGTDVAGITGSSAISSSYLATSASYAITSASYAQSSASLSIRTGNLEATASTLTSASSSFAAQSASLSTRVTNLEVTSSTVSSSFATTSGSLSSRVTTIEGQDATTGSNNFTGPQYVNQASNAISFTSTASLYTDGGLRVAKDAFISGTAYFNNITVYGTSSIEYITSSQVNFGTNIITVNTDTPAVRFGGLSVFDSGSTQLTGSILWDSQNNHWIYSNPSGSSYNSAMLMNGPRNTGSLGTEQGTLNNYITKGQGGDHITSSQIIDDGTTVQIPGNLQVTGSISGSSAVFSGTVIASNGTLVGGTGTTNYLPKFTGASTIGNSAISDNGSLISVGLASVFSSYVDGFGLRATSSSAFGGTGVGVEIGYSGGLGYIQAYNRSTSAYQPIKVDGSTVSLQISGVEKLGIASTGAATFSSSVTAQTGEFISAGQDGATGSVVRISSTNALARNWGIVNTWDNYGDLTFRVSNVAGGNALSAGSTKMVILSSGNVGIGTSSPEQLLTVAGGSITASGNTGSIRQVLELTTASTVSIIRASYQGAGSYGDLALYTGGSARLTIASTGAATFSSSVTALDFFAQSGGTGFVSMRAGNASVSGYIEFYKGDGATRLGYLGYSNTDVVLTVQNSANFIVSGGNVGIGTSSPLAKLSIGAGSLSDVNLPAQMSTGGGGTGAYFGFNKNGSYGLLVGMSNGLDAWTAGVIRMISTDPLYFIVNNNTVAMSITSGGNVLIGTTTDSAGVRLKVVGGIIGCLDVYNNTTGVAANVNIDANGFFARSTSSIKYKKNVEDYTKGLADIMKMRPVTYNSINETETQTYAGLIAEDIHELGLTEFVQYAEDGSPDALSYGNMIALLTKAIQELSAKIDAQAAEINELKNK